MLRPRSNRLRLKATLGCISSTFCLLHVLTGPHSYGLFVLMNLSFALQDSLNSESNRIRTFISCAMDSHAEKNPNLNTSTQCLLAFDISLSILWIINGVFLVMVKLLAGFLALIL